MPGVVVDGESVVLSADLFRELSMLVMGCCLDSAPGAERALALGVLRSPGFMPAVQAVFAVRPGGDAPDAVDPPWSHLEAESAYERELAELVPMVRPQAVSDAPPLTGWRVIVCWDAGMSRWRRIARWRVVAGVSRQKYFSRSVDSLLRSRCVLFFESEGDRRIEDSDIQAELSGVSPDLYDVGPWYGGGPAGLSFCRLPWPDEVSAAFCRVMSAGDDWSPAARRFVEALG